MTAALTQPTEIIADLKADMFGQLSQIIYGSTGELEIETEKYWLTVRYEAETEYYQDEPEIGFKGGLEVSKLSVKVLEITDDEGEPVETENEVIEAFLNENLNLECYGNDF